MFEKLKLCKQPCIKHILEEFCDHKRGSTFQNNIIKSASSSFLDIIRHTREISRQI